MTFNGGWLHAIAVDEDVFAPEFVTELHDKSVGDSIHLTPEQLDEIAPSAELDPAVAGPAFLHEEHLESDWVIDDESLLLYIEIQDVYFTVTSEGLITRCSDVADVDTLVTDAGASCIIRAVHHPRDAYGALWTPLWDAFELLESDDFNPDDILDARENLLEDKGVEFGEPYPQHPSGTYWDGVNAAENALTSAERNAHFPRSCSHGDEYVAIAARDLIGTVPDWTWDAYELIARPYAQATGRKLHPDDPDWPSKR
ncbi:MULTISPECIES: hypothetical protein [Mycobacteriaceae]|uniref:Uncharacterized protein n=1 Tax=Mycolicibacterium senegalense TaxID=1796 RepID=A0ABR5FN01_9MYCO|nr:MULTISPECIES: hypothetical protein [Mycolicibacterium]KLI09391.1 hypothetical protein AA982_05015 [Mycolicibacterium senegalense]KLO47783.1 hypothetical protein ABW05_32035 [Mycolicibacterium senegalense]OMB75192.1 hypothetical protein A5741_03375 [Mycolicibacterium conceptionense]